MARVVRPGSIKNPDQLFNDLAPKIGMNYPEVGVSLGLDETTLTNELDSGVVMMYPANKKAMKMLKLWQRSVAERDCTYKALAAALEKYKINADAFCYMDSPPDSESGGAGAAGPSTPNVEDKNESTVNVSCANKNYDLYEEGGPSSASGLAAFVNTNFIWEGRQKLYVKFMNVQDLDNCGFNKQNILAWANSWRDKEPCREADKVIPKFVDCVEHDAHSDIRVKFAGVGSKDGSYSYIGKQAQDHKNDHTMFLNLSNGGDDYKEHTVVHEFGHALGMLHEHQRPEIWSIVKKYLAPDSHWYKEDNNYEGVAIDDAGTETSATYDTTSVMHYPNFKYGLKYKTIKAIENDHLNQKHAVVLKAIVSMDGTSFCTKPSDIDIDFLRQKYEKDDLGPAASDSVGASSEQVLNKSEARPKSPGRGTVEGLKGVIVCAETHVTVTNDAQSFTWEGYGLKLHIKEKSLPKDTEKITIYIKASITGDYDIHEDYERVSPVFWFRCDPVCKLEKEVTLEIQHCAMLECACDLTFARADCSQKERPYTFELLIGGEFSNQSHYGKLELCGFSGIVAFLKHCIWGSRRWYFAHLFYPKIQTDSITQEIHLAVTWDTLTHITEMKKKYLAERAKLGAYSGIQFENDKITLEPDHCQDGWELIELTALVITKNAVDERSDPPSCQLLARIVDKTRSALHRTVKLNGAKPPDDFLTIYYEPDSDHDDKDDPQQTPGAAGQEEPLYSLGADAPKNALPKPMRGTPELKCLKEFASEVAIILHTTVSPSEKPAVLKDMTAPELDPPVAGPINLLNTPTKIILGMFGGYKCALVQTEQGEKCKNEIEDALEQLPNTQFVIALGMAYGSTKYKFGDVLVSKTIRGVVNPKFIGEGMVIRSSEYDSVPVLDKLSKLFARDLHNWKDFRCSTADRISKVYAGDVISVSWLISSKSIRDSLLSNFPDAIGGEMEGHELVEIQKDYNKHNHPRQLGVIIIKGAADYADEDKQGGKKWQYTAARAATSFAKYKLESTKGTLFDSDQDDKDDPQQTPGATGSK